MDFVAKSALEGAISGVRRHNLDAGVKEELMALF
jgi:hypothetical protein